MGENDGTRGTLNILNLSSSNGASGDNHSYSMIHALFTVRELLYLFYLISLAKNLGQHYRRWSMLTNAMRNIAHFFCIERLY